MNNPTPFMTKLETINGMPILVCPWKVNLVEPYVTTSGVECIRICFDSGGGIAVKGTMDEVYEKLFAGYL